MNKYKIIGKKRPNKVVLSSSHNSSMTELPVSRVRKMFEGGIIHISNPESLYARI